jgi:GT2 family glycosyltransferase
MKVSIVVLNFNGINLLKKFIPQIIKNSNGYDIYVVDNNSSDNSISFLKKEFPEVKIIRNKDNYGYAGGYNNGLKQIDSDLFICLNNDQAPGMSTAGFMMDIPIRVKS